MIVVRVVQNRAPSELSYLIEDDVDVASFIDTWIEQNPERFIGSQSMPIIDMQGKDWGKMPIEYPRAVI